MAYAEPKTNWAARDKPVASDFNRIENNTEANHDDLSAESVARIAADSAESVARIAADNAESVARIAADSAESVARIAADSAINNILSGNTVGGYGLWTVAAYGTMTIPAGMYMVLSRECILEIYTGDLWAQGSGGIDGLIISDGVNYVIGNIHSSSKNTYYRKLA